jgi:hypothetical protein
LSVVKSLAIPKVPLFNRFLMNVPPGFEKFFRGNKQKPSSGEAKTSSEGKTDKGDDGGGGGPEGSGGGGKNPKGKGKPNGSPGGGETENSLKVIALLSLGIAALYAFEEASKPHR